MLSTGNQGRAHHLCQMLEKLQFQTEKNCPIDKKQRQFLQNRTGKSLQQSGSNRSQVKRIKEGQTGEEKWQLSDQPLNARRKETGGGSECQHHQGSHLH